MLSESQRHQPHEDSAGGSLVTRLFEFSFAGGDSLFVFRVVGDDVGEKGQAGVVWRRAVGVVYASLRVIWGLGGLLGGIEAEKAVQAGSGKF